MTCKKRVGTGFREGDEVVLADGTYQGTPGIFLRFRSDVNWADITERNGTVRCHPVAWLEHRVGAVRGSVKLRLGEAERQRVESRGITMNGSTSREVEAWEGEGGAAPEPLAVPAISMSGTPNQVEWAERIKRQVNVEFDRVAASFRSIADRQDGDNRVDTDAVIAILEDKRAEVMSRAQAGYFIRDWQEIGDQVRQMIFHDPRYQKIRGSRAARRCA